jgi:hypothetical protein
MSWHPERNLLAVAAVEDGSKLIDIDKDTIIFFARYELKRFESY